MLPIIAMFISLLSGVIGISCGIIIAYVIANRGNRFEGILSGFTGGLMLSIIYIDVLPEAFLHSGLWTTMIGVLLGIIFVFVSENIIDTRMNSYNVSALESSYLKTALLISIALAFHNIPEGIAIGALLSNYFSKGIKFGIVITIHNIPEGLMIAIPLKKIGISFKKVILISLGISFFMGLGGYLGYILSSVSSVFMSISLGLAGGIMLYITCGEILLKCTEKWKGRTVIVGVIIGALLGIVISY